MEQKEWWLSEVSRRMCEDHQAELRSCAEQIRQTQWMHGDEAIRFVTDLPELAMGLGRVEPQKTSVRNNSEGQRYQHWESGLTQQVLDGINQAASRERAEAAIAYLMEDKGVREEAVEALQHIFAIGAQEDYADVKQHLERKKTGRATQEVDWESKIAKFIEPVQRPHVQLGHPSLTDMPRLLHHGGAHPAAIIAARKLQCSICDE